YSWSEEGRAGIYLGETSLQSVPKPIRALGVGPDGLLYSGGDNAVPGLARSASDGSASEALAGTPPIDSFATLGDLLLMGGSGGSLLAFDTTRPWAAGSNPAPAIQLGSGQDRPWALL